MSTGRKRPERPDRRTADPAGQLPQCFSRRLVTRPLRMPKTMRDTPTPGADYGCRTGTSAPESLKTPSSWNESNSQLPVARHRPRGGGRRPHPHRSAPRRGKAKRRRSVSPTEAPTSTWRAAVPMRGIAVGSTAAAPPLKHPFPATGSLCESRALHRHVHHRYSTHLVKPHHQLV